MSRGDWITETIQTEVPETLAVLAAVLTRLGDPLLLAGVLFVCYWTNDANRWISVIGIALSGVGAVLVLKYSFALPRPAQSPVPVESAPLVLQWLYDTAVDAGGYGFPSGHAMGSTVVYGLIARTFEAGRPRVRYAVAAVLVTVVSLTRVVLAVHFLVDVVAGVVFGIVFLVCADWVVDRPRADRATTALALAVVVGCVAVGIAPQQQTLSHLGLAVGAFTGWQLVLLDRRAKAAEDTPAAGSSVVDAYPAVLSCLGFCCLLGLFGATVGIQARITAGVVGLAVTGAVAVPALFDSGVLDTSRRGAANYRRRLSTETVTLKRQFVRHEWALFDRSILRLAAILYVVPGLIAVESFSEPVQLPSLVIDLLDAPFAVLVAFPVGVMKTLTVAPLGLEWLFDVPALGELLVLTSLFVAYYCCAAVLYNGSQFVADLPTPAATAAAEEESEPSERSSEETETVQTIDSSSNSQ